MIRCYTKQEIRDDTKIPSDAKSRADLNYWTSISNYSSGSLSTSEHRCHKCGWNILYSEMKVYATNRWSGSDNWYHSQCHESGYRCE